MSHLTDAVNLLGLEGKFALSDRWVELQGERCAVYVIEAPWNDGYYCWCGVPSESVVKFYADPIRAIQEGLRRARQGSAN